MFEQKIKTEELKSKSISLTGYRVLLVFAELLQRPCSKEYLISLLSKGIGEDTYSKDTLRRTLNTLKNAGCVISRPTEKNGYLYTLISHPFLPNFSESDVQCLNKIRKQISLSDDYKTVYKINKLFSKLSNMSLNKDNLEKLNAENPFGAVNEKILDKLVSGELFGKIVEFNYFSAGLKLEILRFIPDNLSMKNEKLYLWGYCFKYNQYAFLNVERIKGINAIYEIDTDLSLPAYEIKFTISGLSKKIFVKEKDEEVLKETADGITVKKLVYDEFSLFQRLLPFASDLKSIEPEYVREKFLDKLQRIRKRYCE